MSVYVRARGRCHVSSCPIQTLLLNPEVALLAELACQQAPETYLPVSVPPSARVTDRVKHQVFMEMLVICTYVLMLTCTGCTLLTELSPQSRYL